MIGEPIPAPRVIDIVRQLAQALGAAHAAGIVHRDIKPENIMVRPDGYVKVLDFGVAKTLVQNATTGVTAFDATPTLTAAGTLIGTTAYMSPEQCRGEAVERPSDIFALGIVCYEMLTGRKPFAGESVVRLLQAILTEHPAPPSRLAPGVPQMLDALVLAMLSKDAVLRPTAESIAADLAIVNGAALPAQATGSPVRSIVGRDRDCDVLTGLLAQVAPGRGLIAAVIGEPGIGKTSMVEDVLARWEHAPAQLRPTIARGKCSERLAGTEAYLPILEILDHLLRNTAGGSFVEMMKQVAPSWYVHVATLSSDTITTQQLREDIKTTSQERMKRELAGYFQELSRVRPLVLVLEDVHWADASTVDLLNYLAGRFDSMRVLIVVTYRPSDMAVSKHPFLHLAEQLKAMNALVEVPLTVLSHEDVERYLALEFPGHGFPATFASLIHERTEGHPLFLVDLLRYLTDRDEIAQQDGRWVLKHAPEAVASELPETVRSTIRGKLERLDEVDRKILAVASVQGHEFDTIVVSDALTLDAADVEEHVEVLDRVHRLVATVGPSDLPDRALSVRYRFAHVLYQNVMYGSLQPTRRASYAARVAGALVAHAGDHAGQLAAELAMLYETARDFAASATYFHTAARQAIAIFGFQEALSLANRGLAAVASLPDSPSRRQQELKLQMAKGAALRSTSGWATPEIERVFARARQLCHELNDAPEVFPALWATTLFHLIRGNLLECRDYADQLLVLAASTGQPAHLMAAHHVAGVSREFIGEMSESSRLLERARELHDPAEHSIYVQMFGQDCGITARAMSSRPLWALGFPDRALVRAEETVAIARSVRDPLMVTFSLVIAQSMRLYRGDAAQALSIGDEILALCREYRLPQEAEWSRSLQGAALIALGRTDDGIERLVDSRAVQRALNAHLVRPHFLAQLAGGYRHAGQIERGLAAVDEGLASAAETNQHGYIADLHRERGELLWLGGNTAAAEQSLREAIAACAPQQLKSFELRAATALARLLRDTGRAADARSVLEPVYGWFTEGFDTADLVAARTLLSQIG
jgi:hypothetical protein